MYLSGITPIELPGLNLPITLQSMFAILLPLSLKRRNAAGGILLYLALAALGVPLLATGVGGFEYFKGDSGGYLIGFYIIALTTAILKPQIKKPRYFYVFAIFILQHIIITLCGLGWIIVTGSSNIAFDTHLSPFLPGIVVKSFLGALIFDFIIVGK
ncbi:MAG: biotin transporter BioY, partial [Salibacteraceae bacterium]